MGKLAFVFPGQGSQCVGMGKDFYDNFDFAKDIFAITNKTLGYDLADIIFNGTEEQLKQTEIAQPAIYTVSYIIFKSLNIKPDFLAGHSLGEYVALTASGILSFDDGIKLVQKRGQFIKAACDKNPGGMIAVLGMSEDELREKIKDLTNVEIANYNSPAQIVLSYKGDNAEEIMAKIQAKRMIKLNVSGPFHSFYMNSASEALAQEVEKYKINKPEVPVIFNYSGIPDGDIKSNIINQVKGSVQWVKTIQFMVENGVDKIIEIGPGKVLTGLNKKIDPSLNVSNIEKVEDLEICVKN